MVARDKFVSYPSQKFNNHFPYHCQQVSCGDGSLVRESSATPYLGWAPSIFRRVIVYTARPIYTGWWKTAGKFRPMNPAESSRYWGVSAMYHSVRVFNLRVEHELLAYWLPAMQRVWVNGQRDWPKPR